MDTGEHKIAVLYHIFYEDSVDAIIEELKSIYSYRPLLLFNICDITPGKDAMADLLKQHYPECIVVFSSNKGKDIGGKLFLISLLQQLQVQVEFIIFLHDKKSLQALKSNRWKKELLKIITHENIPGILNHFKTNHSCGIVATKEYVIEEKMFGEKRTNTNKEKIAEISNRYQLNPKSFYYVAGTMFWARAKELYDFFMQHDPLEIRKSLESGNVLDNFSGTYTHSWERNLSWVITNKGFKIHGI